MPARAACSPGSSRPSVESVGCGVTPELRSSVAHVRAQDLEACTLGAEEHRHVFAVRRVREGEQVSLTDGSGGWRLCRVRGEGVEPINAVQRDAPPDPLEIYLAIPKADRPEWVVQKLTEVGVTRIVWLHADRGVVRWDGARSERHRERLSRIVQAAAQQSRRVWFPTVEGPVPATSILGSTPVAEPAGRNITTADRCLAIGPEGGWTPDELACAQDRVDLGPHILRVETAALVAAVLMGANRRGTT